MLDPTKVKIGDRVWDATVKRLGTVYAQPRPSTVFIVWDWISVPEAYECETWFLEALERPTK